MGLQKQPMAIKNRIEISIRKIQRTPCKLSTMCCTRLFKPHFVLVSFKLISSAFSEIYVMLRIITNWTQEKENVVRKYSFWHTTVQDIANTKISRGNHPVERDICYVAERIEEKWQKSTHSELAVKVEKSPFAFPEELLPCYRTAVKHKAIQKGAIKDAEKTMSIKEKPIS